MNSLLESHKKYLSWVQAIDFIEEINALCQLIRSHRGTSTAQLEGDIIFQNMTKDTSKTISESFIILDTKAAFFSDFDANEPFFELVQQWLDIQLYWSQCDAYENFEKHTLLLTSIQILISQFSEVYLQQEMTTDNEHQLIQFLLLSHFQSMESIARLRGLGCYYCAKDHISKEDRVLMRTEIKTCYLLWSNRTEELKTLVTLYPFLQTCTINKLNGLMSEFSHLLESILKYKRNVVNGSEVFDAGTKILSELDLQFRFGLNEIKTFLPMELSQWIYNDQAGISAMK